MLDYQSSVDQMTHQQPRNMIPYQTSQQHPLNAHHQQVGVPTSDGYFSYQETVNGNTNRQPFPMNPAPLAALHSMAEMKPQTSSLPHSDNSPVANYNSAAYYSMKQCLESAAATPHSISDILSRPDLQALQARLGQDVYYNSSCSQSNTGPTTIRSNPKDMSLSGPNRSRYHWPNNGSMLPTAGQAWHAKHGAMLAVKDGKKKNTRPTFTGSQIFALEKTFEQQKYLAGPERGRLAFALGMSESQVKVWFQNRRTKWRKRHSAEQQLAITKRRPDQQAANTQQYPAQPSQHNHDAPTTHDSTMQYQTEAPLDGSHSANCGDMLL